MVATVAKPWIQTLTTGSYHSIAAGVDVYHNGGWPCHDGGQIKAEHLALGKGDPPRSKLCSVCEQHAKAK